MVQEETAQGFRIYNKYYICICCRHCRYYDSLYICAYWYIYAYFYFVRYIENQGPSSTARCHLELHEYKCEIVKRSEMSRAEYVDSARMQR